MIMMCQIKKIEDMLKTFFTFINKKYESINNFLEATDLNDILDLQNSNTLLANILKYYMLISFGENALNEINQLLLKPRNKLKMEVNKQFAIDLKACDENIIQKNFNSFMDEIFRILSLGKLDDKEYKFIQYIFAIVQKEGFKEDDVKKAITLYTTIYLEVKRSLGNFDKFFRDSEIKNEIILQIRNKLKFSNILQLYFIDNFGKM